MSSTITTITTDSPTTKPFDANTALLVARLMVRTVASHDLTDQEYVATICQLVGDGRIDPTRLSDFLPNSIPDEAGQAEAVRLKAAVGTDDGDGFYLVDLKGAYPRQTGINLTMVARALPWAWEEEIEADERMASLYAVAGEELEETVREATRGILEA